MRMEMILQKSVTEFKTCKNDRFSPIQGSPCFVLCPAKWFTFCPHTFSIEPGHFLKIYGEILPCFHLSDTTRFSTLLDYWRIVADPFLSDMHCMTRFFTSALPPPMPIFLDFALPIKFP